MDGLDLFGADDATAKALALQQQQKVPVAAPSKDGGMSWQTIAGIVVAIIATAAFAPRIIKWVG
jgi:hypothetical protein